jgi:hypothetical protein
MTILEPPDQQDVMDCFPGSKKTPDRQDQLSLIRRFVQVGNCPASGGPGASRSPSMVGEGVDRESPVLGYLGSELLGIKKFRRAEHCHPEVRCHPRAIGADLEPVDGRELGLEAGSVDEEESEVSLPARQDRRVDLTVEAVCFEAAEEARLKKPVVLLDLDVIRGFTVGGHVG